MMPSIVNQFELTFHLLFVCIYYTYIQFPMINIVGTYKYTFKVS